ncbi:unnamed protein product, partial [Prorocentrum cordatum]
SRPRPPQLLACAAVARLGGPVGPAARGCGPGEMAVPTALPQIQKRRLQITKDVVPPGLRSLDYWQIMDYWKVFDKNGDGMMDKNEFFFLVNRMNPDPVERS